MSYELEWNIEGNELEIFLMKWDDAGSYVESKISIPLVSGRNSDTNQKLYLINGDVEEMYLEEKYE